MANREKHRIIRWAVAVGVLLLLAAAIWGWLEQNRGEPTTVTWLIGVSEHDLNDPWCRQRMQQIEAGLEDREDIRLITLNAGRSVAKQQQDIQYLLTYGVDLLLISPGEAEALTPAIEEACEQVPVVILDNPVDTDAYALFIGPDNYEAGRQMGEKLLETIPEGQSQRVVEVRGTYTSPTAQRRHEGFVDVVQDSPKVELAESFCADWLTEYAQNKVTALWERGGQPDLYVCQGTAMSYGVFRALDKLGVQGRSIWNIAEHPQDQVGKNLCDFAMIQGSLEWQEPALPLHQYLLRLLEGEELPREIWLQPQWYESS
ncbi:MAG: substrate-binding domain-containing protein [Eubacteriales bacterium]|jgi:ABC-type sugar transport system substrate-binding protein